MVRHSGFAFKGCQFMRRTDAKQRHVKSGMLANANDHSGLMIETRG